MRIVAFRAEMKRLGYAFDWEREVVTADPSYYRWNQWFFLKMLELGLVYRREGKANWCTGCATVTSERARCVMRTQQSHLWLHPDDV